MPTKPPDSPTTPEPVHYWGWTPDGKGRRCGATSGPCGHAQQTTCPDCLALLAAQLEGRLGT